jgi:hypothetical protein
MKILSALHSFGNLFVTEQSLVKGCFLRQNKELAPLEQPKEYILCLLLESRHFASIAPHVPSVLVKTPFDKYHFDDPSYTNR